MHRGSNECTHMSRMLECDDKVAHYEGMGAGCGMAWVLAVKAFVMVEGLIKVAATSIALCDVQLPCVFSTTTIHIYCIWRIHAMSAEQ